MGESPSASTTSAPGLLVADSYVRNWASGGSDHEHSKCGKRRKRQSQSQARCACHSAEPEANMVQSGRATTLPRRVPSTRYPGGHRSLPTTVCRSRGPMVAWTSRSSSLKHLVASVGVIVVSAALMLSRSGFLSRYAWWRVATRQQILSARGQLILALLLPRQHHKSRERKPGSALSRQVFELGHRTEPGQQPSIESDNSRRDWLLVAVRSA